MHSSTANTVSNLEQQHDQGTPNETEETIHGHPQSMTLYERLKHSPDSSTDLDDNANSDVKEEEAVEDWLRLSDTEYDETFSPELVLSAKRWPADISPNHDTLQQEILSLDYIGERTWNRVESECRKMIELPLFKEIGIEIDHLIALSLFLGDYKFDGLQQELMECLQSDCSLNRMRSIYHWKMSVEDALNILIGADSSRKTAILHHGMGLQQALVLFTGLSLPEPQ